MSAIGVGGALALEVSLGGAQGRPGLAGVTGAQLGISSYGQRALPPGDALPFVLSPRAGARAVARSR